MGTVRPHTMPEGGKISQEWIPAGRLKVDRRYERPLSEHKVKRIMGEFDPDLLGTLEVSRRDDGDEYILDGQHRREAVVRLWSANEKLPCLVHHGLARADEARIFAGINRSRTKPRPIDLHRADVDAGDPVALQIDRVLKRHGLRLGSVNTATCVAAVGAVYRLFVQGGEDTLDLVLSVIVEAKATSDGIPAEFLTGLGILLARHGHQLDRPRLRSALEELVPRRVIAEARARKCDSAARGVTLGIVVAELLLNAYNRGRRSRRIQWVLPSGRNLWKRVQDDS